MSIRVILTIVLIWLMLLGIYQMGYKQGFNRAKTICIETYAEKEGR